MPIVCRTNFVCRIHQSAIGSLCNTLLGDLDVTARRPHLRGLLTGAARVHIRFRTDKIINVRKGRVAAPVPAPYVLARRQAVGMGLSACRLFPCDRDHHLPSQNTRTGMRPPPSCANDLRGSQPSCRRRFRGCTATPLLMNWSCVGACDLPIAFTHQGGANAEPVEGLLQGADGIGPLRQAEPVGRVPTETSTASKGT